MILKNLLDRILRTQKHHQVNYKRYIAMTQQKVRHRNKTLHRTSVASATFFIFINIVHCTDFCTDFCCLSRLMVLILPMLNGKMIYQRKRREKSYEQLQI